jgi:hypothetical protein
MRVGLYYAYYCLDVPLKQIKISRTRLLQCSMHTLILFVLLSKSADKAYEDLAPRAGVEECVVSRHAQKPLGATIC